MLASIGGPQSLGVNENEPSGTIFCDITNLDGSAFAGDPRQVLRRNIEKARELGFELF